MKQNHEHEFVLLGFKLGFLLRKHSKVSLIAASFPPGRIFFHLGHKKRKITEGILCSSIATIAYTLEFARIDACNEISLVYTENAMARVDVSLIAQSDYACTTQDKLWHSIIATKLSSIASKPR